MTAYNMSSRQDVEMASLPDSSRGIPAGRPKPWRDEGYPAFSSWMVSSEDFLVLRRFDQVNTRILLLMQDRIARLEDDLLKIDATARQSPDELADSSSLRDDPQTERLIVLERLTSEVKAYSMFLLTFIPPINSWWRESDLRR